MYIRSAKTVNKPSENTALEGSLVPMICQAPGCAKAIPHGYLMCETHWYECPRELRREVALALGAWLGGKTNVYPYTVARLDALIAVGKLHGEDVTALEAKRQIIRTKLQER
jgi:hypothetical protein